MKLRRVLACLASTSAAVLLGSTVPAQAASPEIPLGFHVKYVHLVKGAKAAKVKFTWGCEYGDYSLLVQVEQEPPVTTDYVDYDANHFLEGTCDGKARTYRLTVRPAEISTPGLKLKKGAATQYLGGTMDSFPYVEVDQAHITKKRRR